VRVAFLKPRSSETFLFCYIVDYEIIGEAISRLKANLNKNRSSIIRKENSRSDLLFYEMKREKKSCVTLEVLMSFCFIFFSSLCHCFLFYRSHFYCVCISKFEFLHFDFNTCVYFTCLVELNDE
jgi:hypothetical protein